MQTYEIETLPRVQFAHIYHAETYSNSLFQKEYAMEISYISEGTIVVTYRGRDYEAQQGDIVCLPYGQERIRIRASAYHEHHTVCAKFDRTLQASGNGLFLPLVTPAVCHTRTAATLIDRLIRDRSSFKSSPTWGAAEFLTLLCELDRCNRKRLEEELPSDVRYTQRAKEYVRDHLQQPIVQREVARALSISPEYLCAVFKRTEGVPFQKYVNYEKLEAIRDLMERESAHLYEAAALFGYTDPNYVSRLFKKYYGYRITDKREHPPKEDAPT